MRVIGNIIWLVFGGLLLSIGYLLAAVLMFVLIITIPFGLQALKMASFTIWPFGRTLVKRSTAGAPSLIGNIVWLLLAGWWLALGHLLTGIAQCLTIIGIPLGLANFKLIPVSLWPFGHEIVAVDELEGSYETAVTIPQTGTRTPAA